MNNQQAFNKVWERFIVNRKPFAVDDHNNCINLTKDNNRCAAACLVPIKTIKSWKENKQSAKNVDLYLINLGVDHSLVMDIRTAHDLASMKKKMFTNKIILKQSQHKIMEMNLLSVAKKYNLSIPK